MLKKVLVVSLGALCLPFLLAGSAWSATLVTENWDSYAADPNSNNPGDYDPGAPWVTNEPAEKRVQVVNTSTIPEYAAHQVRSGNSLFTQGFGAWVTALHPVTTTEPILVMDAWIHPYHNDGRTGLNAYAGVEAVALFLVGGHLENYINGWFTIPDSQGLATAGSWHHLVVTIDRTMARTGGGLGMYKVEIDNTPLDNGGAWFPTSNNLEGQVFTQVGVSQSPEWYGWTDDFSASAIPEPASAALLLLLLPAIVRRKAKK
ncbi:MAG: hypothetical protein SVT52_07865 [Planctomycetota bacterium]|nr:hypothetical protein [Planctomycetota bacterium]